MFPAPTVLVLGAGVGDDIGMPVGSALRDIIAKKLDISHRDFGDRSLRSGDPQLGEILLQKECGGQLAAWEEWCGAARKVAQGLEYSNSIDDYLQTHQGDEKIRIVCQAGDCAEHSRARTRLRSLCEHVARLAGQGHGEQFLASRLLPHAAARCLSRRRHTRHLPKPMRDQFQLRPLRRLPAP